MKRKFNKIISLLLVIVMLVPSLAEAKSLSISAWGAIAIDADTGEVLYSKNPDKMLVPASITKVMTTYIIYEEIAAGRLKKDSMIKVSDRVARISRDRNYPMSVPLKAGGQYSVDQFIKLIMIPSASASCIAVAEHISGSEAKFVERMNDTAKTMGIQANFKNSHGARPHYTTARAMAQLVKNFIDDYPDILNYTSLKSIRFNGKGYNILNKFMHRKRYEGVDGFKTGTISEARYCLAATGKQDGRRVISVVLGSKSDNARYSDSKKILDLAFSQQKARDRSREKTKLEILGLPDEIRRNTEYNIRLKFNNIDQAYSQNGNLYLDEELVKSFKGLGVKNGHQENIKLVYQGEDRDYIELRYEMEIPNKEAKVLVEKIKLSKREPALYKDLGNIDSAREDQLKALKEEGIMLGLENGYFGKDKIGNRADFITLLGRIVEARGLDKIDNKKSIYKDVATEAYYNKYLVWASENNLVEGHQGNFMPRKNISQEEAALILDKFLKLYNIDLEEIRDNPSIDREKLSPWAEESLVKLSKTNIFPAGKIDPKEKIKRLDLAHMIYNLWDKLDPENTEDPNPEENLEDPEDQTKNEKQEDKTKDENQEEAEETEETKA